MTIKGKRSTIRSGTFETRSDVRTIALLCQFYTKNFPESIPTSLSALISTALEDYASILEDSKMAQRFEVTDIARQYLTDRFGRATIRRGERRLLKTIRSESLVIEHSSMNEEDDRAGETEAPIDKGVQDMRNKLFGTSEPEKGIE